MDHMSPYNIIAFACKRHAGQPATLELLADRSGRFEYELHGKHAVIGVLEVFPN